MWHAGETVNMSIGQGALLVTPMQVARFMAAVANELGVPYVDLTERSILPDVWGIVPEDVARGYLAVALERRGDGLVVVMEDPSDEQVVGALEADLGVPIGYLPILVSLLACWLVGVVVTGRSFTQGAGWAFLGLASALAWSGLTDEYLTPVVDPASDADPLPGTPLVATLSPSASWLARSSS